MYFLTKDNFSNICNFCNVATFHVLFEYKHKCTEYTELRILTFEFCVLFIKKIKFNLNNEMIFESIFFQGKV